ncbi:hypothetical protein TeGR_g14191 [Tetraparma gracilis]|uniref:HMA domain-containing protein n=1 Tax=Tetraparma gracilis TaxID=2962635 RepID=A0ABQ6M7R2_9STRA|nr:hypothetical protein TeGR_g14191 [Tetraparma gracilis]
MGGSESKPNPSEPDADGLVLTKFDVGMTCGGCSGAVTRILNKIEGVKEVKADVETKTVFVKTTPDVTPQMMLEKLQKWGESAGKTVALPETM